MTSSSQQSGSVVVNLLEKTDYSKSGVSHQAIAKDASRTSMLVCMPAGTSIAEHSTSRTVYLTVLDGRGTLTLMGQEFVLEPGVFVKMLPDQPHSLSAIENLSFLHT